MPFSVLKTWMFGLFGWAMLGIGIYFIWEWIDGVDPQYVVREVHDDTTGRTIVEREAIPESQRDTQGGAPYLACGLALTLLSFGGWIFVLPFTGRLKLGEPRAIRGKQRTVTRQDGSALHVEICGTKGGPTLLLTHGWTLDSTAWNYVKNDLGERFQIIVWDLPGLGRSQRSPNQNYSLEKMSGDLEAVLGATTEEPVVLVGHSIGGMIIQTFCRLFPEHLESRVAAIALVHTTYTNPLKTALGSPFWQMIQKPVIQPLNHLTIWLSPLLWLSNWQSYLNGSLHIFSRISSFAGTQTCGEIDHASRLFAKHSPAVAARGNLAMLRFDEQATLPSINVPVMIVGGHNDRLTKYEASEHLERMLPHAVLAKLKPAGHLGHWERHSEFAEILAEFAEKYLDANGQPSAVTRSIKESKTNQR